MGEKVRLRLIRARRSIPHIADSILFLPLAMALGSMVLFIFTSGADAFVVNDPSAPGDVLRFLVFAGSPRAAATLLGAIVGGWATILGVVFSITLVTVQLTASNYTTQVLSQFEKDKINQLTLGTFVSVVTYSFLVLKTVRTDEGGQETFTPVVGTNLAIIFAIAALFMLIIYLSNLISFVRPRHFVESIVNSTVRSIDAVMTLRRREWLEPLAPDGETQFSSDGNSCPPEEVDGSAGCRRRRDVKTDREGAVAALSWDNLLDALRKHMQAWLRTNPDLGECGGLPWRLRLEKRVGQVVSSDDLLAVVEAPLPEGQLEMLGDWVDEAFQVSKERTPDGDPEYGLVILGDMGQKAAASGVDAQVSISCVAGIFAVLQKLTALPSPARCFLVHVDGASALVRRPKLDLFETAMISLQQIGEAALSKQLGTVLQAMSNQATGLMLREARAGRTEMVRRLLASLLPLYELTFTKLEDKRILRFLVKDFADLAGILETDELAAERQMVADATSELYVTLRQRPEVAGLIRDGVLELGA